MSEPLGEEPDTSRSLSATLKLAAAKGYISKNSTTKRPPVIKQKLDPVIARIDEKRGNRGEHSGGSSRRHQLIEVKEPEYKPEIHLEYTDDTGRRLDTPKEQFRHMCHRFHGKGPGKNKIDKRLKKQNAEKVKVLSTDSTLATAAMMISKQKELQSPYIILSNGKKP